MSLLTKKQFAAECGVTTSYLSTPISRGKVLLTASGLIDTENEFNRLFLEKRMGKKLPPAENRSTKPAPSEEVKKKTAQLGQLIDEFLDDDIPSLTESERKLKWLDGIKREHEIQKLQLGLKKARGEVVPSELMKPVFLQHNQSIVTEFKNAGDELLMLFAKKHSLTLNEIAEMTGHLTACINTAITKATQLTLKSIENVINEHTDKKGIGERGSANI